MNRTTTTASWHKTVLVAAAGAVLALSGCSMLPSGLGSFGDSDGDQADDEVIEADDGIEDGDADDPADDDVQAEPAGEGLDPLPVMPQQVDATVHVSGMEYTVDSIDVIDLDAEADRETRTEGARLEFSGSVWNVSTINSEAATAGVILQWDEPDSGHSFESSGQASSDVVPSHASGPMEFAIDLSVDQLETFDADTARLLIGHIGSGGQAQVPLGDGELITRIPVPQADLVGESFDIEGTVTVTIEEADLRWDLGGGTDDDTAVLELIVRLENNSDGQRCWARGTGSNFSLVRDDGMGTADLGMSDRGCTPSGDSSVSVTGIPVHEDLAGDYRLTHHYGHVEDTIDFTMVDGPGVLLSER